MGLDFTGKNERIPNSVEAHALLEYCKDLDDRKKQNHLAEALFKVFMQTLDLAVVLVAQSDLRGSDTCSTE